MKVKVDFRIMAVEERKPYVLKILERTGLPPSCVSYDDRGYRGGGSSWYNAKKIWLSDRPLSITHRCIIQDDVILCDGFLDIATKCAQNHPNAIWSFQQYKLKMGNRKKDTPYIRMRGCRVSGQIIMLPVQHIEPMIMVSDDVLGEEHIHDACRACVYAMVKRVDVFSTIPSLCDHDNDVDTTLAHHNNRSRKSKVWIGENLGEQDWNSDDYNVSPFATSYFWLPKNDPSSPKRQKRLDEIIAKCRLREGC